MLSARRRGGRDTDISFSPPAIAARLTAAGVTNSFDNTSNDQRTQSVHISQTVNGVPGGAAAAAEGTKSGLASMGASVARAMQTMVGLTMREGCAADGRLGIGVDLRESVGSAPRQAVEQPPAHPSSRRWVLRGKGRHLAGGVRLAALIKEGRPLGIRRSSVRIFGTDSQRMGC